MCGDVRGRVSPALYESHLSVKKITLKFNSVGIKTSGDKWKRVQQSQLNI